MIDVENRHISYYVSAFTAISCLVLGSVVIAGWYTHNHSLIQVYPNFVPMQYNTALGFALGAMGLLLALTSSYQHVTTFVGAAVLLIGALTLIEYLFAIELHIDQLFMEHYIFEKTSHPGRMAPNTALCFSLTGLALFIASLKPDYRLTPVWVSTLSTLIMALGIVSLTGYLVGIETAYGWGQWTKMAIHTATGFIVVGLGIFAFAWNKSKKMSAAMPYWLPMVAGIGSLTVTLSLWQALDAVEVHLPSEHMHGHYADEAMLVYGILLTISLVMAIRYADSANRRLHIAIQAEESRIRSERLTKAIVDTAAEGIITTDATGIIESFNPAAEKIFGYSAPEIIGSSINVIMPENYRSRHGGYMKHYVDSGQSKVVGMTGRELPGIRRNGSEFPMELSMSVMHDLGETKFTGIVHDVSERQKMRKQIEKMAYFDTLTGLPNRSLHYDRLRRSLAHGRRNNKQIAVLFLDLDYFKPINDKLGHDYGDLALVEVSKRLQACIRETDTASRIGGDEFCLILEDLDSEDAACSVADKIVSTLSEPMQLSDQECKLGCSIGICIADQECNDIDKLMQASDNAMYLAKKSGRNCYHLHRD